MPRPRGLLRRGEVGSVPSGTRMLYVSETKRPGFCGDGISEQDRGIGRCHGGERARIAGSDRSCHFVFVHHPLLQYTHLAGNKNDFVHPYPVRKVCLREGGGVPAIALKFSRCCCWIPCRDSHDAGVCLPLRVACRGISRCWVGHLASCRPIRVPTLFPSMGLVFPYDWGGDRSGLILLSLGAPLAFDHPFRTPPLSPPPPPPQPTPLPAVFCCPLEVAVRRRGEG